jgi:hypothetical protein
MPAKDMYHGLVNRLLVADGWRITHDPYHIAVGRKNLFVDLGAEKIFAAERAGKRIAVEVKSFEGQSEVHDLEEALGQYLLYGPFHKFCDSCIDEVSSRWHNGSNERWIAEHCWLFECGRS